MNNASLVLEHLRPAIRKVLGFQDYKEQEQLLVRVDEILRGTVWRSWRGKARQAKGAKAKVSATALAA